MSLLTTLKEGGGLNIDTIGNLPIDEDIDLLPDSGDIASLEFIQRTVVTSSTASVEFTSLGDYTTHLLTVSNFSSTVDAEVGIVNLSNNGGTSYISSGYDLSGYIVDSKGNGADSKSTSTGTFCLVGKSGTGTGEHAQAYMYFYNLKEASKYSSGASIQIALNNEPEAETRLYSGIYPVTEAHNAIRITGGLGNIATIKASLYGVKDNSS